MSLDLTYRPKRFADVLGNAGVLRLLLARSRAGSLIGRSMMFGGPKGSGKTSLARIVARAIFCDSLKDGEPCCECLGCKSVDDGSADSFDEFDAATQGTVERMRSIIEDLEYGTVSGKPRLIILDEAHRLSKQSQDSLLKSMEERRIVVVLCTTEPHSIKTAIRDRVEEYPVSYPSQQDMEARLALVCEKESLVIDPAALALIVQLNGRCPRTSLTSLESAISINATGVADVKQVLRFSSIEDIILALSKLDMDPVSAISTFDSIFDQEGPTWVRDQIVSAISSAMKASLGAKSSYPIPGAFWASRGTRWLQTAQSLSLIDRPNQADVEAVLYDRGIYPTPPTGSQPIPVPVEKAESVVQKSVGATHTSTPFTLSGASPVASPPKVNPVPVASVIPIKKPLEVTTPNPNVRKSIEIDGVIFSSNEVLTSLDKKMEATPSRAEPESPLDLRVEFDLESVPMTEKEFTSGLLQRIYTKTRH